MFNNQYPRNYANYGQNNMYEQNMYEQIDNQIKQLQQMRDQVKNNVTHTPAINQTFQLAPTNRETIKYATSLEEVEKEITIGESPYFSKDMSVVWIKDAKGNIKTYELNEIIPKDSKDLIIENLQMEIEELKGRIKDEQYASNDGEQYIESDTTEDDGATRETTKKNKSTSVPRVSTSKKK